MLLASALALAVLAPPTAWVQPARGVNALEGRRAAARGGLLAGFSAATPAALAGFGEWGPRELMSEVPPKPDENPYIRALQIKTWQQKPYERMRNYLSAVLVRTESNFWNPRYFIHHRQGLDGEGWDAFDFLEERDIKAAKEAGKLLLDSDLTSPGSKLTVFVYKDEEARLWCENNLNIEDTVELPYALRDQVQRLRKIPFYS
jgi:hypothetical protein